MLVAKDRNPVEEGTVKGTGTASFRVFQSHWDSDDQAMMQCQSHMTLECEEVRPCECLHRENFCSALCAAMMVAPRKVFWGQIGFCTL